MKKLSKILLSALITASLSVYQLPSFAAADGSSDSQDYQGSQSSAVRTNPVSLVGENIIFEYVSTVYNGMEQRPVISVMSEDGAWLTENIDFTVEYPRDCVNAGKKTVKINGIGNYKGRFSATYLIEPLDCAYYNEYDSIVDIEIAECSYSGMPVMPDVTVTVNGTELESSDYSLSFFNNIKATEEEMAECTVTFHGNYSGSRTVGFNIAKALTEDFEIQLMVHHGEQVEYDLTPLKPEGAVFGTIKYYSWNFTAQEQPRIAFNELSFTVPDNAAGSTAVVIPVTNAPNCEDYNIVIYPVVTDLIIPTLVVRSPDREYNGEPVTADVFVENGSYATADDKVISGTWILRSEAPLQPCDKTPCVVTFEPTDPRYAAVDAAVFITISRIRAAGFNLRPYRTELALGMDGQFVVSGIPEDYKGEVTLRCDDEYGRDLYINEIFYNDVTRREYAIDFPVRSRRYNFTAELSGDGLYLPAVSQCSIIVGDYVPSEDKPSDTVTTANELRALITYAAEGSTVRADGIRTIPAELVKAASDKRLILEVKLNDAYTWMVDTAELSDTEELDLDISTAVIPAVLLDKIGGENLCSFNIYAKNLGTGTTLCVFSEQNNNAYNTSLFANLFLYNTTGELKFISCTPMTNGTVRIDIDRPGKYAVMTDTETKLVGDLNNDCLITIADIRALLKAFVELPDNFKFTDKFYKYDIDEDEQFKISDIMGLLSIFVNS